jgi:hypothetical protein
MILYLILIILSISVSWCFWMFRVIEIVLVFIYPVYLMGLPSVRANLYSFSLSQVLMWHLLIHPGEI